MYTCGKCGKQKSTEGFHKDSSRKGHHSICKSCRASKRSVLGEMMSNARSRAKKRGIEFDITREFIMELAASQGNKCPYCGMSLNWEPGNGGKQRVCPPDRASLDRINPSVGYTRDNVQLLTDFCNRIKAWYPEGDVVRFCKLVASRYN